MDDTDDDTLIVQRGSEVTPEDIEWVWDRQLARKKLNNLVGLPGAGKSELLCFEMACITTGAEWPDGSGRAPLGDCVYFTTEDEYSDTIVPRLHLLGADMDRIHFVIAVVGRDGRRVFDLTRDIPKLERLILQTRSIYCAIDPLLAHFGGANAHKETEVRSILTPLKEMAARTNSIIRPSIHLNKDSGKEAVHRVMGAAALVAGPRMSHLAIADAETSGRFLLVPLKVNITKDDGGLAYRLDGWCRKCRTPAPDFRCAVCHSPSVVRIEWERERVMGVTAAGMLAPQTRESKEAADGPADALLQEMVPDERRVLSDEIVSAGKARGISKDQIWRARNRQGLKPTHPVVPGPWYLHRPGVKSTADDSSEATF